MLWAQRILEPGHCEGQEMEEWRLAIDVPLTCWRRSGLLGSEEGLSARHGVNEMTAGLWDFLGMVPTN